MGKYGNAINDIKISGLFKITEPGARKFLLKWMPGRFFEHHSIDFEL